MDSNKRVVVGMSGGVDSAVSVAMLQHHGYEVVGATLLFQDTETTHAASRDARSVCDQLGIEHNVVRCEEAFDKKVISPFVADYASGLTPSPCVGCNVRMKIPSLIKIADELECNWVSTGHYARINRMQDTGRFAVLRALDNKKDQSYMLCMLSQNQLARLILPLGGITKLEVRSIAEDLGLTVAQKPESQDICFAPQGYRELLHERGIKEQPGNILNTQGDIVGQHQGLFNYTIGQRQGIGVSGSTPYYVIGRNIAENELIIGTYKESRIGWVRVAHINWQAIDRPCEPLEAMVKLRYRSEEYPCIIEPLDNDGAQVKLRSLQSATSPGQYAVFYRGAVVIGGGIIEEVGS